VAAPAISERRDGLDRVGDDRGTLRFADPRRKQEPV
jgi:hypothetical protein